MLELSARVHAAHRLRSPVEFFTEYASFLAKTVTLVVAILVVLPVLRHCAAKVGASLPGSCKSASSMISTKACASALSRPCSTRTSSRPCASPRQSREKAEEKTEAKPRVFVLDFDGDIKASATESLRHEITALLTLATPKDEVVLRLESGGGMVHSYGLASRNWRVSVRRACR
jgi:serine protease SohB